MANSLLILIDDIATILDDVAVLSKVAAKKTAGVLGDDLALNAQQVVGVHADRELAVVWAVAKGSGLNKVILVPAALLISTYLPPLVAILLIVGGAFLCFEGFEKLAHKFLHSKEEHQKHHEERLAAVANPAVDLVQLEKSKIQGAIRTDFILSAEIVVITLGTLTQQPLLKQLGVLSLVSLVMTVGVYGLVAAIVRLDDWGLALRRQAGAFRQSLGKFLLLSAPLLMKLLSIAGTAAMFLVGGSIVVHEWPWAHHVVMSVLEALAPGTGGWTAGVVTMAVEGVAGVLVGAVVLAGVSVGSRLWRVWKVLANHQSVS